MGYLGDLECPDCKCYTPAPIWCDRCLDEGDLDEYE